MNTIDEKKGVIQICCVCHRVINATQALAQLEACAKEGTGVVFSHGFCSQCYQAEMAKVNVHTSRKPASSLMVNEDCDENSMRRNCR